MPAVGSTNQLKTLIPNERDRGTHEEREIGPEIDEVSVGEDGIGLAQLLIHQIHNQRQMLLASVAYELYLRCIQLLRHKNTLPPRRCCPSHARLVYS